MSSGPYIYKNNIILKNLSKKQKPGTNGLMYFNVVADIDTEGPKSLNSYFSTNSQCYHYSFCPRGGPNSITNFDGGRGRISPLDPPLTTRLLPIDIDSTDNFANDTDL